MTPYTEALEAFNRASHSDALREMQLWETSDGTIPSLRCERCQRATPILVRGLGFDCCADSAPPEYVQADPVTVIRSIDRKEMIGFAVIFIAFGFCAGALFAIGS